jgi:hypothetical protein
MRLGWRIFNLIAAGILVCGTGGLVGLAAALGDWSWRSRSPDPSTALPNEAAMPTDLGQSLTFEEGHYDVVGLAIAHSGNRLRAAALTLPDNQPWYVPGLIAGILPPDDVAAFNLPAFKPVSATLLEWPEQSPSNDAKIQRLSKRPTSPPRLSYSRGRVLGDGQIASIKDRLQLTPQQERLWPAVEAALRNISYTKDAIAQSRSPQGGDQIAYIDLDSAAVQRLKSVASPLIMQLSEDQKREVKSLAHVMGLDSLAASF